MAEFKGSIQEFNHFVGPRIRNLINNFTRLHRRGRGGTCEMCGSQAILQSAHVHGRERRAIIEKVLSEYLNSAGDVVCDIKQAEDKILLAHEPVHETFKFICQPCHTQYDSTTPKSGLIDADTLNTAQQTGEYSKLSRIRLWAGRPEQANSRIIRAFLELETENDVTVEELRNYCSKKYDVENFDQHFASMKTDAGNYHGKVFFESKGLVNLWGTVRVEVESHFSQT
jgi:hypothetical protein